MSKELLQHAPFLPASPPRSSVVDFSGTLSIKQLAALEAQAEGLAFKTKVVILPGNFTTSSPEQFARELAEQWNVMAGRRLLMVVDLKGHNVRIVSSPELRSAGITGEYLSHKAVPAQFIPYIKSGDLEGAISHTLAVVNLEVTGQRAATSTADGSYGLSHKYGLADGGLSAVTAWVGLGVVAAVALALIVLFVRSTTEKNRALLGSLNERANSLYEKADEIGQASEFIEPDKHPELARRVALFFTRLTALEKARKELEDLRLTRGLWKARDGILKCSRLIDLLKPEAEALLNDVNAVTGGVRSCAPLPDEDEIKAVDQDQERVPLRLENERFRRPAWTLEPAYAPPPVLASPGGGLLDLMVILNQIETNRRLDELAYDMRHEHAYGSAYDDGRTHGDWGNGLAEGGAQWGTDAGTDWGGDIGGGDWGGGDGGGGW